MYRMGCCSFRYVLCKRPHRPVECSAGAAAVRFGRSSQFQNTICNEIFTSTVALHNSFNQILRYIGIICQQLFSVLREAIPAISKARIVVVTTNTRIKANTVNNLLGIYDC